MLLITVSALYILWVKNPLHAVFSLILVFINSALLLLSLDVNFIALVYVVLYVGAICVLFLFVVMTLNLRSIETLNRSTYRNELIPFFLSFLISLAIYLYITISQVDTASINPDIGYLFTDVNITNFVPAYIFQSSMIFVLLTLVLLLAIISPIIIASKTKISLKKQDLFNSISRTSKTVSLTI
jgi:NADH:ubiquinone oxidoreductase subunit 6 (subunit J)